VAGGGWEAVFIYLATQLIVLQVTSLSKATYLLSLVDHFASRGFGRQIAYAPVRQACTRQILCMGNYRRPPISRICRNKATAPHFTPFQNNRYSTVPGVDPTNVLETESIGYLETQLTVFHFASFHLNPYLDFRKYSAAECSQRLSSLTCQNSQQTRCERIVQPRRPQLRCKLGSRLGLPHRVCIEISKGLRQRWSPRK
jgi:hypothetical protein